MRCRISAWRAPALACLAGTALFASVAHAQINEYNSLTALWTAPGDDGATGQVSAYELFYDTRAPGGDVSAWWNAIPYSQRVSLMPPLAAAGQPDSAHISGLNQGTTYYFVIVARDEAANVSGFSNVASGATRSCGAPTGTPTSFAADQDADGVRLTWDATTDPTALSLHLYRATGSSLTWTLLQELPPNATEFRDTHTAPSTTYRYRASWAGPELQGVTCEGPASEQAVVTTASRPGVPSIAGSGAIHAYPNPASDQVQVSLDVTAPAPIAAKIRVYDMNGHWLATIAEGTFPPGRSVVTWNRTGRTGLKLAPGYYELLGTVGNSRVRERLVLLP